jgi:hypothetical protein
MQSIILEGKHRGYYNKVGFPNQCWIYEGYMQERGVKVTVQLFNIVSGEISEWWFEGESPRKINNNNVNVSGENFPERIKFTFVNYANTTIDNVSGGARMTGSSTYRRTSNKHTNNKGETHTIYTKDGYNFVRLKNKNTNKFYYKKI